MRHLLLFGLLVLGAFLGKATAGDAGEKQIQEWIHRLETDPLEARHKLMAEIRREATPYSGHPPAQSSPRTDLLPVLEAALGNDDDRVQTEAICTLCYMKCRDALPILEKAFESKHPTVRYYACMGVEWLADEADLRLRVVMALEKARYRQDEVFSVRLHAAAALANLGEEQEPKIFLDALRNPRANEALAASVLARMGRKDAIELMIVRLRTAVPSGDHWLGEALKKLTGQELGTDANAWQEWVDAHRSELPEQLK